MTPTREEVERAMRDALNTPALYPAVRHATDVALRLIQEATGQRPHVHGPEGACDQECADEYYEAKERRELLERAQAAEAERDKLREALDHHHVGGDKPGFYECAKPRCAALRGGQR